MSNSVTLVIVYKSNWNQIKNCKNQRCVKSVLIRSFSVKYFPAFGPNTERYSVSRSVISAQKRIYTSFTIIWLRTFWLSGCLGFQKYSRYLKQIAYEKISCKIKNLYLDSVWIGITNSNKRDYKVR